MPNCSTTVYIRAEKESPGFRHLDSLGSTSFFDAKTITPGESIYVLGTPAERAAYLRALADAATLAAAELEVGV